MEMRCVYIVPVPGQPSISGVTTTTATSISLSWSVPSGSVVTNSEVLWRVFGSSSTTEADGSGTSGSITSTSYTIQELESGTKYSITVTVINAAGSTVSHPILIATSEEDSMYTVYNLLCERALHFLNKKQTPILLHNSFQQSLTALRVTTLQQLLVE